MSCVCRYSGKKSKAQKILEAVLKSLKAFFQDEETYKFYESSWTASMADLAERNSIAEVAPWLPLLDGTAATTSTSASALPRSSSQQNVEQQIREIVPQIVHANWSKKDKDRANEVRVANSTKFDKNAHPSFLRFKMRLWPG